MSRKKYVKGVLSAALSVGMASTSAISSFASTNENICYNNEDFVIEKFSNPTRGQGEIDGILTGKDEDRGQSYSWSMIEHGDYIYVGTCYNPIYGIYYRNLVTAFTGVVGAEKASEIANAAIDLMYDGAFYKTLNTNPAVIKVNKKTYEPEIIYRNEDKSNYNSGYRMAAEYNGKLYFVCFGSPRSSLLEIDPENNDNAKEVFDVSINDNTIAKGIRGLVATDDKLIMSLTDVTDGKPVVKILATSDPSSGKWTEIANQQTFDNLPAVYVKDGINGGGIWDIVEFNGSLYVTMVTSKTDENGVTDKRGFAMYRGDESGNSYEWTQIIGDKSKGAKYSFGLGVNEASAGNIFVYDNHLYIGNYNDPMIDLAQIPNNGKFEPLYNDLYNSINLYRMDTDENIELIGGMANEEFPEVKGNLGQGLGSVFNQYVWRYEEHNGKLYIGTYDTSTITNGFTQLTNGDLLEMTPEEFLQKMKYLQTLLETLKDINAINNEEANEIKENIEQLTTDLENVIDKTDGKTSKISYNKNGIEKTIVDDFKNLVSNYDRISKYLPISIKANIDKILKNESIENMVYYLGINNYCKKAEKGFDLLVSSDGINFEAITRNGFNDKYNHGIRAFASTEEGLFIGTANPFYGTQLWKLNEKDGTTTPNQPSTPPSNGGNLPSNGGSSLGNGSGQNNSQIKFTDIKGHWAEPEIISFASNGYINGYSDGTFRPNNSITRAEFISIFNKYFGLTKSSGKVFSDTKTHWAKNEIDIAVTNGVANGISATEFSPDEPITREQAAVMVSNYKKIIDKNYDKINKLSDKDKVSSWAKDSVEGIIEKGYMTGYSDNTFKPSNNITRAEAVVTLSRIR